MSCLALRKHVEQCMLCKLLQLDAWLGWLLADQEASSVMACLPAKESTTSTNVALTVWWPGCTPRCQKTHLLRGQLPLCRKRSLKSASALSDKEYKPDVGSCSICGGLHREGDCKAKSGKKCTFAD